MGAIKISRGRLGFGFAVGLALCFCFMAFNEGPSTIDTQNFNQAKLEEVLLRQINQERQRNGLGALVVNKPLLMAARDHANFIAAINRLSHIQPTKAKERARQRVEHYGGKMQGLGENTAFIGIGSRMIYQGRNGTRDTVTITTYEGIAEYIINAWLNSNGHKANMLNSEFEYTGISAALNSDKTKVYAVQVFGKSFQE